MEYNERAITEGLNPEQLKAVQCLAGPVLIVAGAGSGKTRVLTCRIANILAKGTDASRVLSLTFTKKAATEMKERVAGLVGRRSARGIVMGTFHSVFIRFLRDYAESMNYPREFTIYDTSDSQSAIKTCLKELNLDDKVYKPKSVLSRISEAKNNLVSPATYATNATAMDRDRTSKMPRLVEVYDLYWKKCRANGVMDFDDILFNMNILLRDNPDAARDIASRFDYILVDEYQDTNRAQYLILKKLAAPHHNICVVGDDSQSIYAFRGARVENILSFRKDYPECNIFRLEQNYRSTQTIVDAANSLISHNENRIPKTCFSKAEEGDKIHLIKAYTDSEEAMLVASAITSIIRSEGAQYKDFAILYRTNAQSRALEDYLRRRNIPYLIFSGNSFFERAEVKDLMAYFKLICNPNDDESFKRIVNKPARGIGDTTVNALVDFARSKGLSLVQAVFDPDVRVSGLRDAALKKVQDFTKMILDYNARIPSEDAYSIGKGIALESGLMLMYKEDNSIEGQSRYANIEELLNSIQSYIEQRDNDEYEENLATSDGSLSDSDIQEMSHTLVTLGEYLENIALLSAVDVTEDEDSSNKVSLMTAHSSKGLEFPYVFIIGMEENLFPSGGVMASPRDIEEERRLFYVALTRARKAVQLSYCVSRMRNGKTESNSVSRFIHEIDPQFIENPLAEGMTEQRRESFWSSVNNTPRQPLGNSGRPNPFKKPSAPQPSRPSFGPKPVPASSAPFRSPSPASPTPFRKPAVSAAMDLDFEPSPISELRAGQRVEHNRFGKGLLKELVISGADAKAVIAFDNFGEKTLLLKYAKIRIL